MEAFQRQEEAEHPGLATVIPKSDRPGLEAVRRHLVCDLGESNGARPAFPASPAGTDDTVRFPASTACRVLAGPGRRLCLMATRTRGGAEPGHGTLCSPSGI